MRASVKRPASVMMNATSFERTAAIGAGETVSDDSDPLRVHLRPCLEEGDARDQVTCQLLHRRQLLLSRRLAGTSVVEPQHDDPVSAHLDANDLDMLTRTARIPAP